MKKAKMLCLDPKRVGHHRGSNSWPRAWPMIRAKYDTTQLFRRPMINAFDTVKIN